MGQAIFNFETARKVYTVSDLTKELRNLLEPKFPDVWVTGEVSNFRAATSGHCYFTLKDSAAQLRVVCFRNQTRYLKFKPQDGVSLIVRGRLAVYEARGEYQLVAEYLEPAGLGALQLAFEQLKQKLGAEGLFDPGRKKPLPVLPGAVGVVTSPTGAVIRDILRVLRRRFRNVNVVLYPVRVQGEGAAWEIAEGIRHFSRHPLADVLIVARGGGSIEDLWAFNEEVVARAIAASNIPIICGVGHETDFTIADFVADLRAPTPSAAAEMVIRRKQDFEAERISREQRMVQLIRLRLSELRHRLVQLAMHRAFQTLAIRVGTRVQKLDEVTSRLDAAMRERLAESRRHWLHVSSGVLRLDFRRILDVKRARCEGAAVRFQAVAARRLAERRNRLSHVQALLKERNPEAILKRGYSITRDPAGNIIRDALSVSPGAAISVRLARGELGATVLSRKE